MNKPDPETEKYFKQVDEVPITILEGRYYYASWYFPTPPQADKRWGSILGGNIMGCIWRMNDEPDCWRMVYRHRYYNSFESGFDESVKPDEKSWYVIHVRKEGAEKELLECARKIFEAQKLLFKTEPVREPNVFDFLMIEGGPEAFIKAIETGGKHWFQMKTAEGEEAEKLAEKWGLKRKDNKHGTDTEGSEEAPPHGQEGA